jgi:tripartite-type tricarboxylate transporter receptor subunit TctC
MRATSIRARETTMNFGRRRFLHLAAGAAALPALPRFTWAQTYPSRPVRLIVPVAAGGSTDILARLLGQWLSERLGRPFIVENRPGAGGNIGVEAVVKAPADGYTLLMINVGNATNAALYEKLPFNFIRDIAPVAGVDRQPYVMLVHPSFPAKTVHQFVAHAKGGTSKISMASTGNGTGGHVSGEWFKIMTGIDMVHVPYRGSAPAMTDLIAGQVEVYFGSAGTSIGHIKAGRLRALAVTTAKRSELLPDIPTVSETLPGYEASFWTGVGAPRGTPADVTDRLNKEINTALADPQITARLADMGSTALPGSVADFGTLIVEETEKWTRVIRAANIKPD